MELKGYVLVPLYPHPPPANKTNHIDRSAPRSWLIATQRQAASHTVVVGAGAVGPAVPGGPGGEPAAAGGAGVVQFSAGGRGIVARLRASAVRGEHGDDERSERGQLDGDRDGHLSSGSSYCYCLRTPVYTCWVFLSERARPAYRIYRQTLQKGATHSAFSKHPIDVVTCYSRSCPPDRCSTKRCAAT